MNLYYFYKYNKIKNIPRKTRERIAKELRQIHRNYPIFIYDSYRYGGENFKILEKPLKKRKLGIIKKPLYDMCDTEDYVLSFDKKVNKIVGNAITEGDIMWFNRPLDAIFYFDYIYSNYKRVLINISVLAPFQDYEDKLQIPCWVYIKEQLTGAGCFVSSGDAVKWESEKQKKIFLRETDEEQEIIKGILDISSINTDDEASIRELELYTDKKNVIDILKSLIKKNIIKEVSSGVVKVVNPEDYMMLK